MDIDMKRWGRQLTGIGLIAAVVYAIAVVWPWTVLGSAHALRVQPRMTLAEAQTIMGEGEAIASTSRRDSGGPEYSARSWENPFGKLYVMFVNREGTPTAIHVDWQQNEPPNTPWLCGTWAGLLTAGFIGRFLIRPARQRMRSARLNPAPPPDTTDGTP